MTSSRFAAGAAATFILLASAAPARAQRPWHGPYLSGHVGAAFQPSDSGEFIRFDKNLDGNFTDTITTAAGANAFSPGFCGGAAVTSAPSGGCTEDKDGVDYGVRLGYDWQRGVLVFGLVGEGSKPRVTDSVAAFSTTPALYTFTRDLNWLGALRFRIGYGGEKVLIYGTGGGAWSSVDQTFATSNTANTFVQNKDKNARGYQGGGGLEFKFGDRMSLGAEYLYTSLSDADRFTVRSQGPVAATNPFILTNPAGTDLRRSEDFTFHSARATLSYRF